MQYLNQRMKEMERELIVSDAATAKEGDSTEPPSLENRTMQTGQKQPFRKYINF